MGLSIYKEADPSEGYSQSGTFTNPLTQAVDGITGGVIQRRYYVRNDDPTKSFTGVTVTPYRESGENIADGTNGYAWKLIAGDAQPLEEQWGLVSASNSIDIPDIGTDSASDIATYEPFWLRIVVPPRAPVQSYSGIKLRLDFTEILVP